MEQVNCYHIQDVVGQQQFCSSFALGYPSKVERVYDTATCQRVVDIYSIQIRSHAANRWEPFRLAVVSIPVEGMPAVGELCPEPFAPIVEADPQLD